MDVVDRLNSALSDRYAIEREIGSGGMATVYLAQDLKHDRKVAVKVLKPELAAVLGAERFLSEIKVTANLQHPHILPLHDSGEADGVLFYVMPYVEGESLRRRLDRERQLPVEEAVRIASEVASALDYAHRHGVIHRDIKPANILLHEGQSMVADFGIALAVRAAGGERLTETGLSLGTPQYMSPEQASGDREVDGRADIYSLGCVLYEMLTGEPPHSGPTVQAILAKLLTDKPRPVTELRETVPAHVAAVVHKALAKLPADRFGSAGEMVEGLAGRFASELGQGTADSRAATGAQGRGGKASQRGRRERLFWPVVAVLAVAVALAIILQRETPPGVSLRYLDLALPTDLRVSVSFYPQLALSPDGRLLAFVGTRGDGASRVFVRALDGREIREIQGTEGASNLFFSPDGEWLGFIAGPRIYKVAVSGGEPSALGDLPISGMWAAWIGDTIYAMEARGINRVLASGGTPALIPYPEGVSNPWSSPVVLPDGDTFVLSLGTEVGLRIAAYSLASGRFRFLDGMPGAVALAYLDPGYLLVSQNTQLRAYPWDPEAGKPTGSFVPLADSVDMAVAAGDLIAYVNRPASMPVWVDRAGNAEPIGPGPFPQLERLRISPNGRRTVGEALVDPGTGIWMYDLDRGTSRFLWPPGPRNLDPVWHPSGRSVTFSEATPEGGDRLISVSLDDGAMEVLWSSPSAQFNAHSWSPDGRFLAAYEIQPETGRDIWLLARGEDPRPLIVTEANERSPAFSPDGRWLAYASDKSGQSEVWVTSFPEMDQEEQVSVGGGRAPVWTRDGEELVYRKDNRILAVPIRTNPTLEIGIPEELFRGPFRGEPIETSGSQDFDAMPDGSRFLLCQFELPDRIHVITNWLELVRRENGDGS